MTKPGRSAFLLTGGLLLLTACGSSATDRAVPSTASATSSAGTSLPGDPAPQPPTPTARESSTASALPSATPARSWTAKTPSTTPSTTRTTTPAKTPAQRTPPKPAAAPAGLPSADTFGRIDGAPVDLGTPSNGNVAGFASSTVAYRSPGGPAIARIPATQLGLATWLPVIGKQPGWVQVRLPTRPNGAVAWVPSSKVTLRHTNWRATVSLSANTITVYDGTRRVGSWPAGKGLPATPTPVGQTFLLTKFDSPPGSYTPSTFVLGVHSDTLDTYGGGPGTVAVHGWPTASGRVGAVSHGCVRVPQATLDVFHRMPLGTPVDIAR
ncbi:L,D-transpeptidase [Flexivirga meconopsidis]|uniref:L,D-transpeptidase n=1 Tax=Flexivirga meconopsidis TaxID=2977121 RepID=UPI00223E957F|nr:L,D-transpeptidase [Flexivirga meconopsidis]